MGLTQSDLTRRSAENLLASAKISQEKWEPRCQEFFAEFTAASQKVVDATKAHGAAIQRVEELKAALAAAEQEAKDTKQALTTALDDKVNVFKVVFDSSVTRAEIEAEILDSSRVLGVPIPSDTKLVISATIEQTHTNTGATTPVGTAVVLSDEEEGEQVEGH
jgi:hypothetical protein